MKRQDQYGFSRRITRREFLVGTAAAASLAAGRALAGHGGRVVNDDPLNILVITCDQLTQRCVGAYGDPLGATPNIDALAAGGVRFLKVYTPCPLCRPARAAFWTGRFPHQTGVLSNGKNFQDDPVPATVPTLGSIFSAAGYETVHFGKTHDHGGLRGFSIEPAGRVEIEGDPAWPLGNDTFRDRYTTEKVVQFLSRRHEKPFLAVAELCNPHDICGWVGANAGPHEDVPVSTALPPLPDNFEIEDLQKRPLPIQYLCCSHNRLAQAARWTEANYRHYLAAYYHYLSRADAEVGRILQALRAGPAGDNTLVVCFADHGDGVASHRMVTKQVSFYEEVTRVPMIFAGPGIRDDGSALEEPLVSLLDLVPTLCEYGGLDAPEGLAGCSLLSCLTGAANVPQRDYVVSEWHTEWGYTISPGRMIRTQGFKYTRYLEGDGEELYDLRADPGERRTLIDDPAYADVLQEHRRLLQAHVAATDDPFFTLAPKVGKRWRSHKLGYPNHVGPAAPMVQAAKP